MGGQISYYLEKFFKLGKAPANRDKRNLKFSTLLNHAEALPPTDYDFDLSHSGIPTPMFAKDKYGCCVISGRAHQTLRFEDMEEGSVLMIPDKDVIREYFLESVGGRILA